MGARVELKPEHVEALNKALDLLVRLDEMGFLDAARDMLDPELIGRAASLLLTPSTLKLLDHVDDLLDVLGSVDYAALKDKVPLLTEALKELPKEAKPVGLLGLLSALRDPDVQRGLGVAVELLRALGRQAKKQA